MEIDRELVVEVAVSGAAVLLFVVVVFFIGSTYYTESGISNQGGLALVGSIVLFVLVMSAIGVWLSRQEF